ncbi:MAG: dTDP-4-dehydrorhamnose reductase [Chloroflexi bacterium]|nr:MAG: dTDP-4-dehydrorhamnose reductase [Chloroflexota bacterium]
MKILLTGAGGQLGRDVAAALAGVFEVHALDRARLDVSDRRQVSDTVFRMSPDWIVNCAAFTDVDRAERDQAAADAVNARAPGYLAEAAARAGAAILHVSTDYVFDGAKGAAYDENDSPNPLNVYGRTKLEGEERVLASGARACLLRTAWLYGRHGSNFVKAILEAARRGGPLRVVADQVGSPTLTTDLADAVHLLLRRPAFGLFHVANQGAASRYQQARAIVGERVEVIPISSAESGRPAPRPANSTLTSVRWEAAGFPSLRPWQEALAQFVESLG